MYVADVEIYSDQTNAAVLRHPGRRFPGMLVKGDSLYALCVRADDACSVAKGRLDAAAYSELNELRNILWGYLTHYKSVLAQHEIPLPFSEDTGA